ncbi:hypothetical protein C2G38_2253207 [Gigaspora rosea]|uniref:Uncharacterized protein n=1 Tax=Gigaspora rosea TaxID=44941 RepID=A0A397UBF7_9GLOM|nr:hypothetical protein C2G38_2253207 [Gigaspora rosea]
MELNVLCCLFPWHLYDDKLVLKDEKAPIINDQLQDYKEKFLLKLLKLFDAKSNTIIVLIYKHIKNVEIIVEIKKIENEFSPTTPMTHLINPRGTIAGGTAVWY